MMYYTHLAFGLLVSLVSLLLLDISSIPLFILTILIFSIFPDIDAPSSMIGKKNKILSNIIKFIFGHRGIFHTIYPILVLFLVFYSISREISIAVLLGYLSHLFMDALTRQGIRPFFPISKTKIHGFIKTNSFIEKSFFLIIVFSEFFILINYFL